MEKQQLAELIQDLEERGFSLEFTDKFGNECSRFPVPAERLWMCRVEDGYPQSVSIPTIKAMTVDWAIARFCTLLEAKQARKSVKWSAVFAKAGIKGCQFYPASYGFGLYAITGHKLEEKAAQVREFLESRGIEYRNEYSDARWVYRFVVSTSKANIQKLLQA